MRKLILFSFVMLFTAGCTTTLIPVGANRSLDGPAQVDIFVGQSFPKFQRRDPYTPLHVTIRNNTGEIVQLRHEYFTLFDPNGRAFVIAPVREVLDWLRWQRWDLYYGQYYPQPAHNFVFREGKLKPHSEIQAIMFFNQATRFGQGTYRLVASIPANGRPLEFTFRLK